MDKKTTKHYTRKKQQQQQHTQKKGFPLIYIPKLQASCFIFFALWFNIIVDKFSVMLDYSNPYSNCFLGIKQGPVVQNFVSLTSLLRPQCRQHKHIHCHFLLEIFFNKK